MQLNKYLALCGIASRRNANQFVIEGRVTVNGRAVNKPGEVIEEGDTVTLDGRRLNPPGRFSYVLLNKPADTITTLDDPRGRKTVVDLIGSEERIFPVGRLDLDTTGVLLLTNDGNLAFRLTHPRFEVEKVYHTWVEGRVAQAAMNRLKDGVTLKEGPRVTGEARILKAGKDRTKVEIRIHEGKKRQIKRMMRAVGHPVISLERVIFAGLDSAGLKPGEWRFLTQREVDRLCSMTGAAGTMDSKDSGKTGAQVKKGKGFIVAIDGPAGSGKSTTARMVARALGWTYLDTGAMYRALALKIVEMKIPLSDTVRITDLAEKTEIRFEPSGEGPGIFLDGREVSRKIRHPDIDRAVGPVCEIAGVRRVLVALQRRIGGGGNIIAEGRDMGTVVFPGADVKFYMEASPRERAKRRQRDLERQNIHMDVEAIQNEIEARDRRDSQREHSPLMKAEDAVVLDTTNMTLEAQVKFILETIRRKMDKQN